MKYIFSIIILVMGFTACIEEATDSSSSTSQSTLSSTDSDSSSSITSIDTSSTSSTKEKFTQSSISKYIWFDDSRILIEYNFLPSGFDLQQQEGQVALPCEFTVGDSDELINISLSAPLEGDTDCQNDIVIKLTDVEYDAEGLIFSFSDSFDLFADQFEFKITKSGFVDSKDGSVLTVEPKTSTDDDNCSKSEDNCIGLEEVYDKIIKLRTS